jgi:hypothetical protein
MPWKFRARGRVFVELYEDGRIDVKGGREGLDPGEARWLDEIALPELRAEYAERLRQVAEREAVAKANAERPPITLPPDAKPVDETTEEEFNAEKAWRHDAMATYLGHKRAQERGEEW